MLLAITNTSAVDTVSRHAPSLPPPLPAPSRSADPEFEPGSAIRPQDQIDPAYYTR